MLNIVILAMTTTKSQQRKQQHQQHPAKVGGGGSGWRIAGVAATAAASAIRRRASERGWFVMKTLRMLLLMLMVLSAVANIQPSMAESETNDLNTLETSKPMEMSQKQMSAKLETRQYPPNRASPQYMAQIPTSATPYAGCPLCDSSVYSYCSHKIIHDTCCCDFQGNNIYQRPQQCQYFDCSLLYAKSCYEHTLIKNCCCNNPY